MDNSLKNTRFYLIVSGFSYEIAEPIGFDGAQFVLEQEDGRYGRDIFFSQNDFEFSPKVQVKGLTHKTDILFTQFKTKGFEADVKFAIDVSGVRYVLGQLDFPNADTDLYQYFKCKIIQDTHQAIVKRHLENKIDLYAPVTDYEVDPIEKEQIILEPIPITQQSNWNADEGRQILYGSTGPSFEIFWANFSVLTNFDIEDSFSPVPGAANTSIDNASDLLMIEAENMLTGLTINITNLDYRMFAIDGGGDGYTYGGMYYRIGEVFDDADINTIFQSPHLNEEPDEYLQSGDFVIENLTLQRGEKLWIYFFMGVYPQDLVQLYGQNYVGSCDIEITTISTSIASTVNGVRLIDAVRHIVKAISGKNTVSPLLESDEFIDQFLFTGNELRGVSEKFTISLDKILGWLPECNMDYEVLENGDIFFGTEREFYTDHLIKSFTADVLQGYKSYFNDRFQINRLKYKYNDYEQGKNELQKDSLQGVSTELEMNVPNKMVENVKEIDIDMIRDAFLLEKTRKDGIKVTENASTEDDEDIFILDTVYDGDGFPQNIKVVVRHTVYDDPLLGVLLVNDGSFNWLLLGIEQFDIVNLFFPNNGFYIVATISPNILRLQAMPGTVPDFSGSALTGIYFTPDNLFYKNRLGEGFTYQEGLTDYISNLRFAPKRNLLKYWSEYLRTSLEYNSNKTIKNSYYRNGGDVVAWYSPEMSYTQGRQDRDINTNLYVTQILTPEIVECDVLCDFADFMDIQSKVRGSIPNQRGYIEVERTDGTMVKLHPKKLMYDWNELKLSITGEVRKN